MILYKYILKNHFAPFLFAAATLMFIFLLQFMMKFADKLVGKGLDTFVVIQLIVYNLAWMVVLVVPMAVLVSSLMAFGAMSQNNEVTIMKSSGVSLYRMMVAPLAAGAVVGYLLLLFNNDVLPDANHQAKNLMQDISRKKPTLSLEPGVFSQEVSNYAILVRGIEKSSNKITDVTIYDYTNPNKVNVVTAKEGNIFFSGDQTKLIMDLREGEIHETNAGQTKLYRKLVFNKHRIAMNADQFSFQQSSPIGNRGDRELSSKDMRAVVDSLSQIKKGYIDIYTKETSKSIYKENTPFRKNFPQQSINYIRVIENIRNAKNITLSNVNRIQYMQGEIDKYKVEIHKKYALPAACIIFVLIGAPLGVMVRKGGFGVAAGISLFFFLIYWAFLIGGEKLADRNLLSPFLGMWAANFIIGIIGVFLMIRSAKEIVNINISNWKRFIPKALRDINEPPDEQVEEQ
ncbi:MAG TPA: LptF/LptG family permease [Ignavibacteriaceae bacterium]|nr:LptF/LptG family permease [Ignavibacteriaceae bacterium]